MISNEEIYSIFRLTGNFNALFAKNPFSQIETVDVWPSPRSSKKNVGVDFEWIEYIACVAYWENMRSGSFWTN